MESVKRIEIITGAREVDRIEKILNDFEIRGYVIHGDITGKGNCRVASPNVLTGEFEDRLITTTCATGEGRAISPYSRDLREPLRWGVIVYDAQCTVS